MKLWVDDIRTPPDDSWHICRSVLSAIRAIDLFWPEITHINLDHDISHQVIVGKMSRPYPCDETFEAVAIFIRARSQKGGNHPIINIHTSNPAGAKKMKAHLQEAGYEPEIQITHGANRLETIL